MPVSGGATLPQALGPADSPAFAGAMIGRIVWASSAAALNSNLSTGGGTDDTAALQAVLNTASASVPLELIINGVARVTGLAVSSNTTIRCLPGCGFYLANGSNSPILYNAHRSKTVVTESRIAIIGGTYNGNRANQSSTLEGNGTLIAGMSFMSVDALTLKNIKVIDPKGYAIHIGNVTRLETDNVELAMTSPGMATAGTDCIHVNGPARYLSIRNTISNGGDDVVALNANDGTDTDGVMPYWPNGAITDAIIDGVTLNGARQGVRLLSSTNRVDRITTRNIKGTAYACGLQIGHFSLSSAGNFGTITVSDFDVRVAGAGYSAGDGFMWSYIAVQGVVENLVVDKFVQSDSFDERPALYVDGDGSITALTIVNSLIPDGGIVNAGTIGVTGAIIGPHGTRVDAGYPNIIFNLAGVGGGIHFNDPDGNLAVGFDPPSRVFYISDDVAVQLFAINRDTGAATFSGTVAADGFVLPDADPHVVGAAYWLAGVPTRSSG